MSLSAGSLLADLGLNIDPFAKGMLQSQGIAQLFPSVVTNFLANPLLGWVSLAKTAAAGVGSAIETGFDFIKNSFFEVAESAHSLGIEADKAGVSASFLGKVGAAAKEVNLPIDEVARSMAFLSRNAADAAEGNEATAMTFAKLGISVYDSTGHVKDTEGLFREVADAIAGLDSPAKQAAFAMDLLSRGGLEMLPILKKGSAGVDEASARIRAASGGMDKDLIGISDKVVQMEHVWDASWVGIKRAVATPFLRFAAAHAQDFERLLNRVSSGVRTGIGAAFTWIEGHTGGVAAAVATAAGYASRALYLAWDVIQWGIGYIRGTAIPVIQSQFARAVQFLQPILAAWAGYARQVLADWQPLISWVKSAASDAVGKTLPQAFANIKPYAIQARDIFVEVLDIGKQVSHWALTEAAPAIGSALKQAFVAVQPAVQKLGPLLSEFLDYLKESYVFISHYITPALQKFGALAKPIVGYWLAELKILAGVLGWVFDKVTTVLHYFNQAAHKTNAGFSAPGARAGVGGGLAPSAPSGVAVGFQAVHAGTGVAASLYNLGNRASSIAATGLGTLAYGDHSRPSNVTVNAKVDGVDVTRATGEIAAKLRPAIQDAARKQREQLNRAGDAGAIGGAL